MNVTREDDEDEEDGVWCIKEKMDDVRQLERDSHDSLALRLKRGTGKDSLIKSPPTLARMLSGREYEQLSSLYLSFHS